MRPPCLSAVLLSALLPVAAGSAPPPHGTLVVPAFAQRRSDRFTTNQGLPGARVSRIVVQDGEVRAQTDAGSAVLQGSRWEKRVVFFTSPAVEASRLPKGVRLLRTYREAGGRTWAITDQGPFRQQGSRFEPFSFPKSYLTRQRPVDIDANISCVAVDPNGVVWLGSDVGLFASDGANYWNVIDRTDGLPYEDVTCLALAADGTLWAGTTEGVCRLVNGTWQYYWGPRWLPHNRVNDLAVAADGSAWVATEGGVAHLYDESATLEAKAAHFQQITDSRHNRRGFVTAGQFKKPGDPSGGIVQEASDNDGLWTAVYVGAQAFRWAATKDPAARAAAKRSMGAMLDLVKYSGVPGFPARAIILKGEEVYGYNPDETVRVPGETDKIWYQSPVDPNVLCKGDTSSDELDGHYFAWGVYYDLVADEPEKAELRKVVMAVTDNLLEHDLTLVGPTGRKTRWGVYHPKYMNDDPMWWEERGLNALSILSYLKLAEHVSGDAKYTRKYRELIDKHHYALNTVMQKVAGPWERVNHSDDQMAFMMYYNLLQLERDPATRRVLLQSLTRSWGIERPEHSPFFNFVYGAMSGQPCDVEAAALELQAWPWELIDWRMQGSHRHDVGVLRRTVGRSRMQLDRALPASERRLMRWNGNPYEADGGSPNGQHEEDGSAWLLPFWMGRYHGFLAPAS